MHCHSTGTVRSITGAGIYTFTTASSLGCDSTTTLNLSVSSVISKVIDSTVCANALPFDWNGQSITCSRNLYIHYSQWLGCDSTTTLNLSVNSVISKVIDSTVCANALPFDWNGQSITGAGTYTFTTISSLGCDSTTTLNLSVKSVINKVIDSTVCANALPFDWNGQTITGPGTYTFTTASALGCDSTTTLNLSVNSVISKVIDSTVCANALPFDWNGQTITGAGTYTFTTASSLGCDSTTTLNLSVNSVISKVIDSAVCANVLPFDWNGQTITGAGTYTFTTSSSLGCDSTTTLNLSVSSVISKVIDSTVCANALPFDWNGQTITGPGTYTFTTASSLGCDSTIKLNLVVSNLSFRINNPPQLCAFGTVDLTSGSIVDGTVAGLIFSYWRDAAATSELSNPKAVGAAGTYYIKAATAAGCFSIEPIIVVINEAPRSNLAGGATICSGSDQTLSVTFTGTAPFGFTYSDGVNVVTISSIMTSTYSFTVHPTLTTTYTITNTTDATCSNSGDRTSATVTVLPALQSVRYSDIVTTPNTPVQLSSQNFGAGSSYVWSPPTGLNDPFVNNPIFNHDQSVQYTISITTPSGCTVVDTLSVRIKTDPVVTKSDLFVPKAWTPNGDGHNDKLFPLTMNIRQLKYFRVFNRWGQLVFETNALGFGWDGTYRGKLQVSDTYMWVAEAVGEDGRTIQRSGNSVLLK